MHMCLTIDQPVWWPLVQKNVVQSLELGTRLGSNISSSKKGFITDNNSLRWPLVVYKLFFI